MSTSSDPEHHLSGERSNDERLIALVGCIHGIVLEFDGEARYLNAWADDPALLARSPEELVGKTIDEVLGPVVGAPFTHSVKHVFATGDVVHFEYPLDLPTGRRWFFADVKRVGSGPAGHSVVFFARDITERKAMEEALRSSEERFRLAARATSDVLWDWDIVTGTLEWSESAASAFGPPEPVLEWWKDRIHPDDARRIMASVEDSLADRTAAAWSGAYRFRDAVGEYLDIVDRAFIVRNDEGRAVRMVGSMTDVTKLNRLQSQLVQADRLAAMALLAGGIGHEINNPLAAIALNLEAARECVAELGIRESTGAELAEMLREASKSAARIERSVASLKSFAVIEDGPPESLEVEPILESVLRLASNEIRHRATLTREFAPTPKVMGTRPRLAQLLLNLVLHATRAVSVPDLEKREVRIAVGTDALGRAVIAVSDSGPTLDARALRHVFDPFFVARNVEAGHGLGLSISRNIVESMGGEIVATPREGGGTTVTVSLPSDVRASKTPEVARGIPQHAEPRVDGPRKRLLVIDDEPVIGDAIGRILRNQAEVVVVRRAREALERLKSGEQYGLILCDLMMPEMSGWELYDALREERPEILPRVVFMSGGAFTEQGQRFLDAVPNRHLTKPLTKAVLRGLMTDPPTSE